MNFLEELRAPGMNGIRQGERASERDLFRSIVRPRTGGRQRERERRKDVHVLRPTAVIDLVYGDDCFEPGCGVAHAMARA